MINYLAPTLIRADSALCGETLWTMDISVASKLLRMKLLLSSDLGSITLHIWSNSFNEIKQFKNAWHGIYLKVTNPHLWDLCHGLTTNSHVSGLNSILCHTPSLCDCTSDKQGLFLILKSFPPSLKSIYKNKQFTHTQLHSHYPITTYWWFKCKSLKQVLCPYLRVHIQAGIQDKNFWLLRIVLS